MDMKTHIVRVIETVAIMVAIILIDYYLIPGFTLVVPLVITIGVVHHYMILQPKQPLLLVLAAIMAASFVYKCVRFAQQRAEMSAEQSVSATQPVRPEFIEGSKLESVPENKTFESSIALEPMLISTKQEFEELVLKSERPVALKVFATWCPPCNMMAPLFKQVAQVLGDKILFVEADVDKFTDKEILGVTGLPTVIFYKQGAEVSRIMGYRDKAKLMAECEALITSPR